jgi:hypothetical protein
MSSPVRRDNNQPAGTEASEEVESAHAAQSLSLRKTSDVTQRLLPVPPAQDSDGGPDDLLARAIGILEREQDRWQAARSQDALRRGERS